MATVHRSVWHHLLETYRARAPELPPQALQVRGIWNCDYALKATPVSSPLKLRFVLVQTDGQGCCHLQVEQELDHQVFTNALDWSANDLITGIGKPRARPDAIAIAALDAVYATLIGEPAVDNVILGSNAEKAQRRARIVCNHALRLLDSQPTKHPRPRILNVGCIGDFLSYLRNERDSLILEATDFAYGVVNQEYHGVRVQPGRLTPQLVAEADVVIVTGMTLQTDTLDEIIDVAHANNTRLVMFAETGAHFAEEYCRLGVDVVVSEPFPFYLMSRGPSILRIYERTRTSSIR